MCTSRIFLCAIIFTGGYLTKRGTFLLHSMYTILQLIAEALNDKFNFRYLKALACTRSCCLRLELKLKCDIIHTKIAGENMRNTIKYNTTKNDGHLLSSKV